MNYNPSKLQPRSAGVSPKVCEKRAKLVDQLLAGDPVEITPPEDRKPIRPHGSRRCHQPVDECGICNGGPCIWSVSSGGRSTANEPNRET